jgi:uncharacterized protein YeaO (DUF488 family)
MAEHSVQVAIRRVYDTPEPADGVRVLVDRLWARGVSKDAADLDAWMKELGPSDELRTWFGHQPDRWDAFVAKYRQELAGPLRQLLLAELQGVARDSLVTLVYGAHDTKENEAAVLRDYLLRDQAHPTDSWDAPTRLLLTAAVVAAAHPDAVAPTTGLKRFASPILSVDEVDGALRKLVAAGSLRESAEGWTLTPRAERQAQQLARTD